MCGMHGLVVRSRATLFWFRLAAFQFSFRLGVPFILALGDATEKRRDITIIINHLTISIVRFMVKVIRIISIRFPMGNFLGNLFGHLGVSLWIIFGVGGGRGG